MDREIKIGHIADCHLRAIHYGDKNRGEKFAEGVINACKKAKENNIDFVVCSGDLLDSNNPGTVVVNRHLPSIDNALKDIGVSLLVTSGNHDNCNPSWLTPYTLDSNNVTNVNSGIVYIPDCRTIYINKEDYTPIKVLAIPYTSNDELLATLNKEEEKGCKVDIVMAHCEVAGMFSFTSSEAISPDNFPATLCSVYALGHIHKKAVKKLDNGTILVYPGSTELCSEDEDNTKNLAEYTFSISDNENWVLNSYRFIPFKTQKVYRKSITTEDELEEALEFLEKHKDVIAFISYSPKILNIVQKLNDIKSEQTCLRLKPIVSDKYKVQSLSREDIIKGPSEFFKKNMEKLIPDQDIRSRVESLCNSLLLPDTDSKACIMDYCNKRSNNLTI